MLLLFANNHPVCQHIGRLTVRWKQTKSVAIYSTEEGRMTVKSSHDSKRGGCWTRSPGKQGTNELRTVTTCPDGRACVTDLLANSYNLTKPAAAAAHLAVITGKEREARQKSPHYNCWLPSS